MGSAESGSPTPRAPARQVRERNPATGTQIPVAGPSRASVHQTPPTRKPAPTILRRRVAAAGALLLTLSSVASAAEPWSTGPSRWFVSTKSDVGFAYLRPRLATGYGRPHYTWGGVEANPILSSTATGGYAGLHLEHPVAELRGGALYFYSFRRSFLPLQDSYDRRDVELIIDGQRANYVAWSAELELNIPIGFGEIHGESEGIRVARAPRERATYLESIPAVIHGRWAVRQQVGYSFPIRAISGFSLGAVGEAIYIPERDNTLIWRGGAIVRWWLYDTLQLRVTFIPVISSPDRLGLQGGDFGEVGLRHYWASKPMRMR